MDEIGKSEVIQENKRNVVHLQIQSLLFTSVRL